MIWTALPEEPEGSQSKTDKNGTKEKWEVKATVITLYCQGIRRNQIIKGKSAHFHDLNRLPTPTPVFV
jgi:hypothetical protein